ncbi:ATP-binding protein [Carnimonas nigrificans]|uniref:ATP-binding protein n=1 Tax=Carnimonas nigrificans TaxID=64323 RepID=UPI0004BAC7AA|nr:ATP-binding protein [Carnimonas nigrificans]
MPKRQPNSSARVPTIQSIRRYLTRTVLLILLATSAVSLLVAYVLFRAEVKQIHDDELRMVSAVVTGAVDSDTSPQQLGKVAHQLMPLADNNATLTQNIEEELLPHRDHTPPLSHAARYRESALAIGFWSNDGKTGIFSPVWGSGPNFEKPYQEGFTDLTHHGQSWRVYSHYDQDSQLWIAVGIRGSVQEALSRNTVLINWLLDAIAVIIAGLFVFGIIQRATQPIDELSTQLSQRDEQDLTPVSSDVPEELHELKRSLNDFMARLDNALQRERRFTGDAAHELRTPLAALKIHLDNIRSGDQESAARSLEKVNQGIDRLQRVIAQLLTLARVDSQPAQQLSRINLYNVAAQMAGEMLPLAERHQHELSVTGLDRVEIYADATEVGVLLRNLIDNALRYTRSGSTVEVHLSYDDQQRPTVAVLDNGDGIDPQLIDRVTERFRRGASPRDSGSGLGLSIVEALLKRQHAELSLTNRPEGGLEARVTWPNSQQR